MVNVLNKKNIQMRFSTPKWINESGQCKAVFRWWGGGGTRRSLVSTMCLPVFFKLLYKMAPARWRNITSIAHYFEKITNKGSGNKHFVLVLL